MKRIATLAAALLALAATPAHAFEGAEHQRMSDLALYFALAVHCPAGTASAAANADCTLVRESFPNPFTGTEGENVGYGMVTRCVDFFLTPEKMIAGYEDRLFDPKPDDGAAPPAGDAERIVPRSHRDYARIRFERHCRDALGNVSSMQASHSNHTHFQAELIASQHLYHAQALAMRQRPRANLYGALLVNAIADHYLHDFFAPGHIATFRSHISDIYANALHDAINASGATLRFDDAAFDALLKRLEGADRGVLGRIAVADPALRRALRCAPQRGSFLTPLPPDTCVDDAGAPPEEPCWLAGARTLGELLRRAADRHAGCGVGPRTPEGIALQGDNRLWRQDQWRQRLLMLATQMQSILEVLRADAQRDTASAFTKAAWKTTSLADGEGARIEATLDGDFRYRFRFPGLAQVSLLPWGKPADLTEGGSTDVVEIAGRSENGALWLLPKASRHVVLSLGLNYETPRFGDRLTRRSLSLEMPVFGVLSVDKTTKRNVGVAVGALAFRESRSSGMGLSIRPGMVFTQTETFFSVPIRFLHYADIAGPAWRTSWGLRLDQGFSSFMTVYLSFDKTTFVQSSTTLQAQRGTSFGAGVVFAAPLCRIPVVGGFCS